MTAKTKGVTPQMTEETVSIPGLDLRIIRINLVGDSPLITNKWDEKAKKQMLDKQMKKATQGKEAKDPKKNFFASLYWLDGMPKTPTQKKLEAAEFGFPTVGFKASAVNACSHVDGLTKVVARGAFHINGDLVKINGTPTMREDMVRVGMGTADIRYRGEFKEWSTEFDVRYNHSVISPSQIVNLFNVAGFSTGVGEWRPQKNGSMGMFHVE